MTPSRHRITTKMKRLTMVNSSISGGREWSAAHAVGDGLLSDETGGIPAVPPESSGR